MPDPDLSHISEALRAHAVPIADLKGIERNARSHPDRNITAICDSLTAFGQVKPLVLDVDGKIAAGNGTVEAARRLGWAHIAVVKTNLSGDEARAFALADNRTGDLSSFSMANLADDLRGFGDDLKKASGFDDEALQAIFGPPATPTTDDGLAGLPPPDPTQGTTEPPTAPGTNPGPVGPTGEGVPTPPPTQEAQGEAFGSLVVTMTAGRLAPMKSALNEIREAEQIETIEGALEHLVGIWRASRD